MGETIVPASCDDCGARYGADGWCDVVIPDDVWNSLGAGLLCFRCMTRRLEAAGYGATNPVPVIVASGPYRDANEEWRLIGLAHGEKNARAALLPPGAIVLRPEEAREVVARALLAKHERLRRDGALNPTGSSLDLNEIALATIYADAVLAALAEWAKP